MFHSSSYATLAILCLLAAAGQAAYVQLSVAASPTTISTAASYTFSVNRNFDPVTPGFIATPNAIPLNSVIVVTFPSDYTTLSATSSPTCTNTNSGASLTCTVDNAARTITISDYYATSATQNDAQISVQVGSIINPTKATTTSGRFHLVIQNSGGTTIDESPPTTNTNAPTLTFTSANFACTNIVIQPVQWTRAGRQWGALQPSP